MYKIQQLLQGQPNNYHNLIIWAACCIAFFSFLRCSEFTTTSQQEYDPHVHLQYKDVAVDCRNNPSMVRVQIKQSKLTHSGKVSPYGWRRLHSMPSYRYPTLLNSKGITPWSIIYYQEWDLHDETGLPVISVSAPHQNWAPTEALQHT